MNKRGTGAIFCLIGGIIFAARYISAALFMSSVSSWDSELFSAGLQYVGNMPLLLSIVFFSLGILYILWQEIDDGRSKRKNK